MRQTVTCYSIYTQDLPICGTNDEYILLATHTIHLGQKLVNYAVSCTSTIANEMYEQGFPQDNEGLGAAWAVLLFVAVIPIVFVNARNQRAMREGT